MRKVTITAFSLLLPPPPDQKEREEKQQHDDASRNIHVTLSRFYLS